MTTNYRVFLFSSDVGRLTHEADFATEEEAKASVNQWIGDRDWEEELAAGMFRIDTLFNAHLKGTWHVNIVARTAEYMQACKEFSSTIIDKTNEAEIQERIVAAGKKQQVILTGDYPTYETAKLEIDRAVDEFLLNADTRLYSRIQRENREKGIHQRFITDAEAFGYQIYAGEYAVRYRHAPGTSLKDLQAIRFKPESMGRISERQAFTVESGALRVTDPCYGMDTWCAGTSENVMNGQWFGHIQYFHEAFDSYSLERWNKLLADFEKGDPDLAKVIADAAEVMDPERLERISKMIQERALEEFNQYGNPDDWQGRVAYLHIRHQSVLDEPIDLSLFTASEIHVGVDSGQAGFFDLPKYAAALADKCDNSRDKNTAFEKFYDLCGAQTLERGSWGAVDNMGVVSSSGYGDGGYTLLERRNEAGELVEARIVYIGEEQDEEEGDEE